MATSNEHIKYIANGLSVLLRQNDVNHIPIISVLDIMETGKLETAKALLDVYLECWNDGWDTYTSVGEFLTEAYDISIGIDELYKTNLLRLQNILENIKDVRDGIR